MLLSKGAVNGVEIPQRVSRRILKEQVPGYTAAFGGYDLLHHETERRIGASALLARKGAVAPSIQLPREVSVARQCGIHKD
jgi:hypothetical protein